ncbi:cytochrome P450 [Luteimonas sp. SDU82]|uniref:cytochrome P450 n=1 Tax=Luteimonas sp. SDU82 TaxID=3422592 RepID=UPI003EC01AAF
MQDFDFPAGQAFWQAPAAFFQTALATGPAIRGAGEGAVAILGHAALHALARAPGADGHPPGNAGQLPGQDALADLLRWGLFMQSSPLHRELRKAVIAGLSTRRMDALQTVAAATARELVQALHLRSDPDLVAHVARPLAARVFCALVGLDAARADDLARTMAAAAQAFEDQASPGMLEIATGGVRALLADLDALEARGDSALLADIARELPAQSPASAAGLVAGFAFDAIESVGSGLACALDVLLRHDLGAAMAGQAQYSIDDAVQEAFRLTSPTMFSVRMAREPLSYGGTTIAPGTTLHMWWISANHDPRAFHRPELFDPVRGARGHLTFGGGGHACLGRRLAGMLAREALGALRPAQGPGYVRLGQTRFLPRYARMPEAAPLHRVG